MPKNDLDRTFAGYVALVAAGAIVAIPQVGLVGLLAAGAAIYTGACFMDGFAKPSRGSRKP